MDRDDEIPVGAQLAWLLRGMIRGARLPAGERLPGAAALADLAGVNVNTVRAVLRRLEAEGLVYSRHGLGTFVAEHVEPSIEAEALAASVLERAGELGVDPRDVARAVFAAAWQAGTGDELGAGTGLVDVGPPADEAAARRELRRQIGRLEAQLASYPQARSGRQRHPLLRPKAHVADVGELESVRDELMERLADARASAERRDARRTSKPSRARRGGR